MTDERRSAGSETTQGGDARERAGPSFTTHPTGDALAKDLREVRSKPERAFNIGAALGLTLAVATFIFLIQNNGPTDFEWLWFDFELPLWAALVGALVTGALLILTALAVHRRRRRRIGRRERAAGRLEQALVGEPRETTSEPTPPSAPSGEASTGRDEPTSGDVPPPAAPRSEAPPSAADGPGGSSSPPAAAPDAPLRRPTGPRQVRGPMQG